MPQVLAKSQNGKYDNLVLSWDPVNGSYDYEWDVCMGNDKIWAASSTLHHDNGRIGVNLANELRVNPSKRVIPGQYVAHITARPKPGSGDIASPIEYFSFEIPMSDASSFPVEQPRPDKPPAPTKDPKGGKPTKDHKESIDERFNKLEGQFSKRFDELTETAGAEMERRIKESTKDFVTKDTLDECLATVERNLGNKIDELGRKLPAPGGERDQTRLFPPSENERKAQEKARARQQKLERQEAAHEERVERLRRKAEIKDARPEKDWSPAFWITFAFLIALAMSVWGYYVYRSPSPASSDGASKRIVDGQMMDLNRLKMAENDRLDRLDLKLAELAMRTNPPVTITFAPVTIMSNNVVQNNSPTMSVIDNRKNDYDRPVSPNISQIPDYEMRDERRDQYRSMDVPVVYPTLPPFQPLCVSDMFSVGTGGGGYYYRGYNCNRYNRACGGSGGIVGFLKDMPQRHIAIITGNNSGGHTGGSSGGGGHHR